MRGTSEEARLLIRVEVEAGWRLENLEVWIDAEILKLELPILSPGPDQILHVDW